MFLSVVVVLTIRGIRQVRAENAGSVAVSLIATAIYFFCMWIPSRLQEQGLVESKLDNANFLLLPTLSEISDLSIRWSVELLIVAAAEVLGWALNARRNAPGTTDLNLVPLVPASTHSRELLGFVLIFVGIVATFLLPAPALEDRGSGGQGIPTLMRTFLIVGLAYVVYHRGFGKRAWWMMVLAGILLLASTGVRSPLLVVILGFIASGLPRNRFKSPRRVLVAILLIVVFALGGSYMSNWRENVARHQGLETSQVLSKTFDAPWVQVYESGIDTLDGYRFSQYIAPLEDSRPEDLLNIVLTIVPRAIWEGKPTDLSVEMSARYLNYSASGQYLSPVGYLTLALGSYTAALLGLFIFVLVASLLIKRYLYSFVLTIILCVVMRFFLGGSSFDIYYGLTLLVPYLGGILGVKFLSGAVRRPRRLKHGVLHR